LLAVVERGETASSGHELTYDKHMEERKAVRVEYCVCIVERTTRVDMGREEKEKRGIHGGSEFPTICKALTVPGSSPDRPKPGSIFFIYVIIEL
jgi:hypothetical protein